MTGRRVVVTGLGMVAPVGLDVTSCWENILAGKSGIKPITHFDVEPFSVKFGGPIYGLDVAKDAIRRTKDRAALVMEGYTDVITAHAHGFDNAVAVLGTALGPRHIQVLRLVADRVVLVLDGDEAGLCGCQGRCDLADAHSLRGGV